MSPIRTRRAAFRAAIAVTLGAGGIATVAATISSEARTVIVPITVLTIDGRVPPATAPSPTTPSPPR